MGILFCSQVLREAPGWIPYFGALVWALQARKGKPKVGRLEIWELPGMVKTMLTWEFGQVPLKPWPWPSGFGHIIYTYIYILLYAPSANDPDWMLEAEYQTSSNLGSGAHDLRGGARVPTALVLWHPVVRGAHDGARARRQALPSLRALGQSEMNLTCLVFGVFVCVCVVFRPKPKEVTHLLCVCVCE